MHSLLAVPTQDPFGRLSAFRSSSQIAVGDFAQNLLQHLINGECSGIQLNGIICRLQRGHRTLGIALIALPNLLKKTREINIIASRLQLQVTSASTLFRTRGEEYLQRRVGKYHSTHITPVRDQSRCLAEGLLSL